MAGEQGELWSFTLFTFENFDTFHPLVLADWAQFAGLDRAAFERSMADEKAEEHERQAMHR